MVNIILVPEVELYRGGTERCTFGAAACIFHYAFSLFCVGNNQAQRKLNVHVTQIVLPIFYMDFQSKCGIFGVLFHYYADNSFENNISIGEKII